MTSVEPWWLDADGNDTCPCHQPPTSDSTGQQDRISNSAAPYSPKEAARIDAALARVGTELADIRESTGRLVIEESWEDDAMRASEDLDASHGALYRLLAVDCPDCGVRRTVPTGRGRNRLRQGLERHLVEAHGWRPEAAAELALRFVPRITGASEGSRPLDD